jgi:hypothetical protein
MNGRISHLVDVCLSILMYADDTIFFVDYNFVEAPNMKLILSHYKNVLHIAVDLDGASQNGLQNRFTRHIVFSLRDSSQDFCYTDFDKQGYFYGYSNYRLTLKCFCSFYVIVSSPNMISLLLVSSWW